jgi:hypothetical protein
VSSEQLLVSDRLLLLLTAQSSRFKVDGFVKSHYTPLTPALSPLKTGGEGDRGWYFQTFYELIKGASCKIHLKAEDSSWLLN